jgi:hypothetical protein
VRKKCAILKTYFIDNQLFNVLKEIFPKVRKNAITGHATTIFAWQAVRIIQQQKK